MKKLVGLIIVGVLGGYYNINAADIYKTADNVNRFAPTRGEKETRAEVIYNHAIKGTFHVELPMSSSNLFDVKMYDNLGRVVYQSSLPQNKQNKLSLEIRHLPKGKYYLKIKAVDQICAVKK